MLTFPASAQQAVQLPAAPPNSHAAVAQSFQFVTDGPFGYGWGRPKALPHIYFHQKLPAVFSRTITLTSDLPVNSKLSWIFTGPRAGFTVELSPGTLRVFERYYDSTGLEAGPGPKALYPQRVVRGSTISYTGTVRQVRVILDRHLALEVWLNGKEVANETCLFDVTRHQLAFSAPRSEHHVITGALLAEPSQKTSVTIDPNKSYQTMLGFGGSPSVPAYAAMPARQQDRYWDLMKRYNLLIDREFPMGAMLKPDLSNLSDLADATPHYYGDNFPNGAVTSFAYNKRDEELGGKVIYEIWQLPSWATQSYTAPDGKVYPHAANPKEYARAVVEYCRLAVKHTGQPPAIVGLQNEVYEPPEIARQMAADVRAALDQAGFQSVKIHMGDAPFLYEGIERARMLRSTPAIWKDIDFAASHEYDFQHFIANPDLYDTRLREMKEAIGDKPFLLTELCLNDPHYQAPSYRLAFSVAQLYHKNLTMLDAVGLLYCWTLLDVEQPTFGGSRALMVPDRALDDRAVPSSFELRVLGAYSRHIVAGMHRVGAESSNPDLLATAFTDAKGQSTVVMINRSVHPQQIHLVWPGKHWVQMEQTSQYRDNHTTAAPANLVVQPGEIVTLSTISAEPVD